MSDSTPPLRVLLDSLTSLERQEERRAFLDFTCRDDPGLRARLERLLALRSEAQDFFDIETAPVPPEETNLLNTAEDATESVGTRIGRYRLIERLGEGGCGVVYLAEQQEPVQRRVALKIIRLGMDTENVITRFEMERQSLAMMDHPNIARVLDCGATRTGRPYFVMQLVDGEKITDYCDAKHLNISQRLKLFIRICQAIQHAHQKGVIHRDIKPSNIIVWEHDGEAVPKVIDFGIAKATSGGLDGNATFTAAGQFVGTPAYMSPEQASGHGMDVDTRSDVYSLGSLLYELLAGSPPFDPAALRKAGVDEIRHLLRDVEPRPPSAVARNLDSARLLEISAERSCDPRKLAGLLKGDLDRIVMKAMAKDRQHRYGTADAFATDVSRFLNNEPVLARKPSRLYQFRKLVRRNRVAFTAASLVLITLVLGLGGTTWMFIHANGAREAAELARTNESLLRQKAEIGQNIARAAVLLKHKKVEEADALLDGIPPASAQPSLESADTFNALGRWHAREGRWQKAADRLSALVYSITSVDESDTDSISLPLLPAAASACEAGDLTTYQNLRNVAIERFGRTRNSIVAEQVMKACLIMPADRDIVSRLEPLEALVKETHAHTVATAAHERIFAAWREFVVALMEYRRGNLDSSLEWITKWTVAPGENAARDTMAWTLRAMIWKRQGRDDEARTEVTSLHRTVSDRFAAIPGIFDTAEPQWQDWIYARVLLREADALVGRGPTRAGEE